MRWPRTWLETAYGRLPHSGYAAAGAILFACAVPIFCGWAWTWLLTVGLLTMLGLSHLATRREHRGGKPFWLLGGTWLSAAICTLLAHWDALGLLTPWFSLARYLLIAMGWILYLLSAVLLRPSFVREPVPTSRPAAARAFAAVGLFLWLLAVGFIAYATPFQLAMAPRYPGLEVERVSSVPSQEAVYALAWSPDSQRLLAQVGDDVWLITPERGEAAEVARDAWLSRQPWLASGRSFVLRPRSRGEAGIRVMSVDDGKMRRLLEARGATTAVCSPAADEIAVSAGGTVWVTDEEATDVRPLVTDGHLGLCSAWSPDGTQIMFIRCDGDDPRLHSTWVAGPGRRPTQLPIAEMLFPEDVTWVSSTKLCAVDDPRGQRSDTSLPSLLRSFLSLRFLDADGTVTGELRLRTPMDGAGAGVAADGQGRFIAINPGAMLPIPHVMGRVFLLDAQTGKLYRIPQPGRVWAVSDVAWSPDGRLLALVGEDAAWEFGSSSDAARPAETGVWVVSGF